MSEPRPERGSVTIVTAGVLVVALVVSVGAADVARALIARSHARTAADAVALAVAQELAMPSGRDPVELATAYAEENGATLVACECDPETFSATVEVEVVIDGFLLVPGSKTVRAIAHAVVDLPSPAPTASSPSASPSA